MFTVQPTGKAFLPEVAKCQVACFPESLATRLGIKYVEKTLEWFLINPKRFLFHIEAEGKVVGYCGGFLPAKIGDGSSSGMLQHAFSEAIKGILRKPWLIFHPEVRQHYPFLWMNIKRKLSGKTIPMGKPVDVKEYKPGVGLVVIGVHPGFRGSGVAQALMQAFEDKARALDNKEMNLTVKASNLRAINAYKKFGWSVKKQDDKTFLMNKVLQ
jgi:ribosomal protein S18 acetylase RimI-like enzyme